MTTQKYMGRHQLIKRLTAQVGNKDTAIGILQKRGQLEADGKTLTKAGMKRNNMTAKERALDRASKGSGKTPSEFKYDPKTNRATLRK
jgi:hypothetical protein